MKHIKIYHNPRCSKSRQTLALLQENQCDFEVVNYLENPISKSELKSLALALNLRPKDFIRSKESVFKEMNLDLEDDDRLFEAMSEHPILLERPIVSVGVKAKLGRPPENILELLK